MLLDKVGNVLHVCREYQLTNGYPTVLGSLYVTHNLRYAPSSHYDCHACFTTALQLSPQGNTNLIGVVQSRKTASIPPLGVCPCRAEPSYLRTKTDQLMIGLSTQTPFNLERRDPCFGRPGGKRHHVNSWSVIGRWRFRRHRVSV